MSESSSARPKRGVQKRRKEPPPSVRRSARLLQAAEQKAAAERAAAKQASSEEEVIPWSKIDHAGVLTVWQDISVCPSDLPEMLDFFRTMFDITPTPVGCVTTLPSRTADGAEVAGTGGRCDFFFFVEVTDMEKIAFPRVAFCREYGQRVRWWEDIFFNREEDIYPTAFRDAYPDPIQERDSFADDVLDRLAAGASMTSDLGA